LTPTTGASAAKTGWGKLRQGKTGNNPALTALLAIAANWLPVAIDRLAFPRINGGVEKGESIRRPEETIYRC
jgi:hypothetical protein